MNFSAFHIKDFDIAADTGADMTLAFQRLFQKLSGIEGEKNLTIPAGRYDFYPEKAEYPVIYISNTTSQRSLPIPIRTVPVKLADIDDLTVDAAGAEFIMHGAMTNLVVDRCHNCIIKGLSFDSAEPKAIEAEVIEKGLFSAKFRFCDDVSYRMVKGRPLFYGTNFEFDAAKFARFQWANAKCGADDPERIRRAPNPFTGVRHYRDLGGKILEVVYWGVPNLKVGDKFALIEFMRDEVGILIRDSEKITFDGVKEYFNLSHAYVAQNSRDLTILNGWNAPREGSSRFLASVTDFCHFSMCSGKICVENCFFSGASDDVLNVHGIHFKVTKVLVDTVEIRFMHRESYGFLPFEPGDEVEFVNRKTLLPIGNPAVVLSAHAVDLQTISLLLNRSVEGEAVPGAVLENVSKCADLDFIGNRMRRVSTRGVLVTTRGKVRIENNEFYKLGMSGVLISNDARSWYESGGVRDVVIKNNRLIECGSQAVRIFPEYSAYAGAVHKNIRIENNEIVSNGTAILIRGAENVTISENTVTGDPGKEGFIKISDSENIKLIKNNIKD